LCMLWLSFLVSLLLCVYEKLKEKLTEETMAWK
jgi:hypothetical protein